MIYELLALASASPQTGDDFPATKLIIIGAVAAAAALGAAVFAKFKKDDKDE